MEGEVQLFHMIALDFDGFEFVEFVEFMGAIEVLIPLSHLRLLKLDGDEFVGDEV